MIQEQSNLFVADNSGAKRVKCIKVLGGSRRRYAYVGDIIKVSVQESSPKGKVKAGDVLNAVVVKTKYVIARPDGVRLRFERNAVALLSDQLEPIGTRVFGPFPRELKAKFTKLLSLATVVL